MANIKSAKKRILVNKTKADRNKAIKSGVKTAIKKVYAAVEANDKEAAQSALLAATSAIHPSVVACPRALNFQSPSCLYTSPKIIAVIPE